MHSFPEVPEWQSRTRFRINGRMSEFHPCERFITNGRADVNQGILVPEHEFPNKLVEGFRVFFVEEVASIQDGQFRPGNDTGEFF